jgi:hypothetical protein
VNVGEGIIVVRLLEIDRVQNLDLVSGTFQKFAALDNETAFGKSSTNTELFGRTAFSTFERRKPTS